jgi:chemotaxis protein methyltransferase CheR
MAILLEEEGLYERCRIYATDMNEALLHQAEKGGFPVASMQVNTANYLKAACRGTFSRYYTVKGERAVFEPRLRRNVVFALHNLATDGAFNEFNAILCRNVLIYFNRGLQDRVHALIYESLGRLGYLGLGSKESLRMTPFEARYEELDRSKLYRKVA